MGISAALPWNCDSLSKPPSALSSKRSEVASSVAIAAPMESADLELYDRAVEYVLENRRLTNSALKAILRNRFEISSAKAVWLTDQLDAAGLTERPIPRKDQPAPVGTRRRTNFSSKNRPTIHMRSWSDLLEIREFIDKLENIEKNGFQFLKIKGDNIYFTLENRKKGEKFLDKNPHFCLNFDGQISRDEIIYYTFSLHCSDKVALDAAKRLKSHYKSTNNYIDTFDNTDEYDGLRDAIEQALRPILAESSLSNDDQHDVIAGALDKLENLHSLRGGKDIAPMHTLRENLPLPSKPPALWVNDRCHVIDSNSGAERLEDAGEFARRVYGQWLGKGMTRNLLRKLDNPLFQALYRAYGAHLPNDLPLPTKKEENDRWIQRVEKEGLSALTPEGSSEFALREAQRLLSAKRRRERI